MKICIVTHTLSRMDGQGRVNYELVRYLCDRNHTVLVIASSIDPTLEHTPNLVWHPITLPNRVPTALLKEIMFSIEAKRILQRETQQSSQPIDIVHLNGCITDYPADVNASHFVHSNWLNCKFHPARSGGLYGAYQWLYTAINAHWERQAYRRSRCVVAVSEFVNRSLIDDAKMVSDRITVIPNGVDATEFRPLNLAEKNALRAELQLPDSAFIVFFTGDIKLNRKNLDLVLRSLPQLSPNVHLAIAGDPDGSPYPAIVDQLNLGDRVHFLGYRADLSSLLRGANAFAFPSHYDPFSLAVVEALASGIPVITVPSVGASALIHSGHNGFVLEDSNDLDGMIATLSHLERDRAFAQTIGLAGRETAQQLDWNAMAARYEKVYQELLQQQPEIAFQGKSSTGTI